MKIIQITDTHFVEPGQTLYGKSPKEHLELAVEQINRLHGDAEMLVITGDLAHCGREKAYRDLHSVLDKLHMPYNLVIGNHDNREVLKSCFPELAVDEHGYFQYTVETPVGIFIMIDTKKENTHGGTLCPDRLEWLKNQFQAFPGISKYLFMHHAPFKTQLPCIDIIGLENSDSLAELVTDDGFIHHIFCGHAHRPMAGSWHGIPVSCLRGMNHQVVLDFHSSLDSIPLSFEQPQYCVCFITPDSVVVHHQDFLDTDTQFLMDDYEDTIDLQAL